MWTSLNLSKSKDISCSFMQRSLTGFKNLDEVEYLEMKVDTRENSLGNFGKYKVYFFAKFTMISQPFSFSLLQKMFLVVHVPVR